MNDYQLNKLEKRNKMIRIIILSIAVIAALIYTFYVLSNEDESKQSEMKAEIISGAIKENKLRDKLYSLIK